jgi:hypothetical protein
MRVGEKSVTFLIIKEECFGQSFVFFLVRVCTHEFFCADERQEDLHLEKEQEGLLVSAPTNWFPSHMCLILYF